MRWRIYKLDDGSLRINFPAYGRDIENEPHDKNYKDCEFIYVDSEKLPHNRSAQLYCDGDFCEENLRYDENWENLLMHSTLIQEKHLINLDSKIDSELEKNDPNPVELIRHWRAKEKCMSYSELEWYEQALENLDARIENGESDKKTIRKKLKEKIKELKGE